MTEAASALRHHDGFLQHAFATSPWLGAVLTVLIIIAGLVLGVIKKAGRALEGVPWYVRLGLLAAAGFGIFRLLNRKDPRDTWQPPDGSA